jgi:hypothetical protein
MSSISAVSSRREDEINGFTAAKLIIGDVSMFVAAGDIICSTLPVDVHEIAIDLGEKITTSSSDCNYNSTYSSIHPEESA